MTDPANVKRHRPKAHRKGKAARKAKERKPTMFTVGQPVTVDVRPAIQAFVHGRIERGRASSVPTVRYVRRGHWRNQAYGKGWKQHRMVWVEPHWVGKVGLPIAIRPHEFIDNPRWYDRLGV
jgi:hypothetical protein